MASKLRFDVEFAAKGVDEVQRLAQGLKTGVVSPAGAGTAATNTAALTRQASDLERRLTELAARYRLLSGAGTETTDALMRDLGRLPAGFGAPIRAAANLGTALGSLATALGPVGVGLAAGAAVLAGLDLALGGAADSTKLFALELEGLARARQRAFEDFDLKLPKIESREDTATALREEQRKLEDMRAEAAATGIKINPSSIIGNWGESFRSMRDGISRAIGGEEFNIASDDALKFYQVLEDIAAQEQRVAQLQGKGRNLGPDQKSLDALAAASDELARGELFRGDYPVEQMRDLEQRISAATDEYGRLSEAARKAAMEHRESAGDLVGQVASKADEINRLKDQLSTLREKNRAPLPNEDALARINKADGAMGDADVFRTGTASQQMELLQQKIAEATSGLPALRDAAVDAAKNGADEADRLAAKYAAAAGEVSTLKDRLDSIREEEAKRQFKLNQPDAPDRLQRLGLAAADAQRGAGAPAKPDASQILADEAKRQAERTQQLVTLTEQLLEAINRLGGD